MTTSLWKSISPQTGYPYLTEEIEVDVAIVGAGITGITSAYLLSRSGKKVAVLESGEVAGGTTGGSTGNLYSMIDKRLHHIQSKWDKETAGKVTRSRTAAVDLVEKLVQKHEIDCQFKRVPWYLFSETNEKDLTIEKEMRAAADYGLEAKMLYELPIPIKVSQALKVENQAQFDPAAFVKGLAANCDPRNCRIFENSPVHEIEKGEIHVLSTPHGKVRAKNVILATHTPKGIYALQTAIYPYREYAIAARLKSGEFPEGIFWDTEAEFHHSLRSFSKDAEQYLVVVGGHHKVGKAEDNQHFFDNLEQSARKYFDLGPVDFKWSAQHYKPADGLPFIGESPDERIYLATGFSTDGLIYGVLSAMIFADLLNGRENEWVSTYDSGRFTPVKSAKEYLKENIQVMKEYLKVLPGTSDADDFSEVDAGEGKVVDHDGQKLAVYRDEEGEVHCLSAFCSHMYCVVDWNNAEKTWDCPCHGSRFKINGEVIEGPALKPLEQKDFTS
ncbi:FAD-dependent oxidoreductase [Salinimicrobium soli]|uniref:FAD-dependent oxidoreductase n=1 Tax=Salinimicrobium soli TaxID=1254399 RepID=UPI003AB0C165